jgi:tRNA-specific 2-thiouridylase
MLVKTQKIPGPLVLIPNGCNSESKMLAASICVGYSKAPELTPVDVSVTTPKGHETLRVIGVPPGEVKHFLL